MRRHFSASFSTQRASPTNLARAMSKLGFCSRSEAIRLEEGKHRHLRRLLGALGIEVLRLVRVAIGPVQLASLPKGHLRHLRSDEVSALAGQDG